ncbi:NADH:ubiquinone oxidoreductase 17.2 kDa subunit family protein [Loa loa]|uniref:NADH:ubiquinone oxidoreductase 17.2 kDa subunit family protein n=1 Tax=Loa loa TaxID=7209 RepID=A0A1I7VCC2_LOALO|nr:NADH:ubiquinone oxidoreductase 17.2 kDa subunit family protein [Loa loa]EFO22808.1 NADH:ubiquinone oxidoreductase 17.2 kDa subunit family protein [Loa loa]
MTRRPGVLTFIWRNFLDSFDRKRFQKTFVGSDEEGNRYYELTKSKRIVNRGFIPAVNSSEVPSPEWLTWLRGLRKLPPTQEEILANRQTSEEMAEKVEKLERNRRSEIPASESKKMPYIESTTISDDFDSQPRSFPRYADYDKKQLEMT